MESTVRLLSFSDDIELPEIKILPKQDNRYCRNFSRQSSRRSEKTAIEYFEDENFTRKMKLIKAYKAQDKLEFSDIIKFEYQSEIINNSENETKRVFWRTLLTRPLEEETFEEIKNELFFPNNEAEFIYLTNIALNQPFYCNFHQIISINRIVPRKEIELVVSYIENYFFSQLGIKNFNEFKITNCLENFQINVLKYILYLNKVEIEKQRILVRKLLTMEPLTSAMVFFELILALMDENSEPFFEKFDEYVDSLNSKFSPKEVESVLTAECNLLVLKALASDLEDVLEYIIKKSSININRLKIAHGCYRLEIPLLFYIAERGYNELLKAVFESKKQIQYMHTDSKQQTTSLLTFCLRGYRFYRREGRLTDLTVDYDDCVDLILKNANKSDIFINKSYNPMADAMRFNYDNAVLKLIHKFGLTFQFLSAMNERVLKKYLDQHIKTDKAGIAINFHFLTDQTIKDIMRKPDLKPSIQHPVIANYIELKYTKFWPLHVMDLFLFVLFSVAFPITYFFMRQRASVYSYLLYISILYSLIRFGYQVLLFYHSLLIPNISRFQFTCHYQDPATSIPFNKSRIIAGFNETLIMFFLMIVIISHLFTNSPEYLFSASLVLMTIEMTKMLSRISPQNVSKYILMFKTVALTLSITIAIFFWIIVAFTLAFHVVFYESNPNEISKFDNFWTSFTTTMTIFMGGHEGQALRFSGWWNLMLFAIFVLVAISLYNLAIDLAMENAKELRDNSDFVSLEKQFDTITEYNEFFYDRSQPFYKIIFQRKPEEATWFQEIYSRCVNRLQRFDRNKCYQSETVLIRRTRYDALNKIIRTNEAMLLRTDNDVKIDEIEKTVRQLEDSNHRIELKLRALRHDSEIRKDRMLEIKNSNFQTTNKLEMLFQESSNQREQLKRIFTKLETVCLQLEEMQESTKK